MSWCQTCNVSLALRGTDVNGKGSEHERTNAEERINDMKDVWKTRRSCVWLGLTGRSHTAVTATRRSNRLVMESHTADLAKLSVVLELKEYFSLKKIRHYLTLVWQFNLSLFFFFPKSNLWLNILQGNFLKRFEKISFFFFQRFHAATICRSLFFDPYILDY